MLKYFMFDHGNMYIKKKGIRKKLSIFAEK